MGFSKKIENHACAVALHYMHYNFERIHKTLRVSETVSFFTLLSRQIKLRHYPILRRACG